MTKDEIRTNVGRLLFDERTTAGQLRKAEAALNTMAGAFVSGCSRPDLLSVREGRIYRERATVDEPEEVTLPTEAELMAAITEFRALQHKMADIRESLQCLQQIGTSL